MDERGLFRENALLRLDARIVGRVDSEVAGIRRQVGKRRGLEVFARGKYTICRETQVAIYDIAVVDMAGLLWIELGGPPAIEPHGNAVVFGNPYDGGEVAGADTLLPIGFGELDAVAFGQTRVSSRYTVL